MEIRIKGLADQEFEDNQLKLQIRNNDFNKIKKAQMLNNSKSYSFKPFFSVLKVKFCLQLEITKGCMVTQVFWKKIVGTESLGMYSTGGESEIPRPLGKHEGSFVI